MAGEETASTIVNLSGSSSNSPDPFMLRSPRHVSPPRVPVPHGWPRRRSNDPVARSGKGEAVEDSVEAAERKNNVPRQVPCDIRTGEAFATAMVYNSHYGSINPSILAGFDEPESEDLTPLDDIGAATQLSNPKTPLRNMEALTSTRPAFRYPSISRSILSGFGNGDDDNDGDANALTPVTSSSLGSVSSRRDATSPTSARRGWLDVSATTSRPSSSTSSSSSSPHPRRDLSSNNDSRHSKMVVEHQQDSTKTSFKLSAYPAEGVFSFGQTYSKTAEAPHAVIFTNQRLAAVRHYGEEECIVCTNTKPVYAFPTMSITKSCNHPPETCLECISASIRSDLNNKIWNEIGCPECPAKLDYEDVENFADAETLDRYQKLSLRRALSEAPNFRWCPTGCGYGQCHDGSYEQPIVTCLLCRQRSCFRHEVVWHENLKCDEYDAMVADPENFQSQFERDNEAAEAATAPRRAQEDADRALAESLLAEEEEWRAAEARRREEERERRRREEQRQEAAEARRLAALRKAEEKQGEQTVARTSKPCPGCNWPIEKNSGCSHMTCIKCKHEFCYECGADYYEILRGDNSAHRADCRFHPDNTTDRDPNDFYGVGEDEGEDEDEDEELYDY